MSLELCSVILKLVSLSEIILLVKTLRSNHYFVTSKENGKLAGKDIFFVRET